MIILKTLFLGMLLLSAIQSFGSIDIAEQFKQVGYVEMCDTMYGTATFDALYASFDELITFLQTNPAWAQKLYAAGEHFIRTKGKDYYAIDFFGFYDESEKEGRNQISFYYAVHFHEFVCSHYPEFNEVPEIIRFLQACCEIQTPCGDLFNKAIAELGLETIFASQYGQPPIFLKIIKYLPSYRAGKPHYDRSALSLFLDSTDNQSLLLSPYRSSFTVEDFVSPSRTRFPRGHHQNTILLVPGTLLTEFSIYPAPHIVVESGNIRYATIAFAMRPHHVPQKNKFSLLPSFKR